ncbi:hypothetical protein V6N11_006537 [Hibiscus sabdariffa]|uniref:Lipoxygenase n=2 Tax=Hibiscus sabdariffa TaxID=183260 RepID=A0ABR2RRX8_9ROSI
MGMDVPTKVIKLKLKFEVARDFGIPGAFAVENKDKHEFFLKSARLRYINNPGILDYEYFRFYCGSWIYPISKTRIKRIFFSNQLCLPKKTPKGLEELRRKELEELRGGSKDERKPWDRTYEYDCYNDLGDPDNGRQHARPVLGGSPQFPYPRRLRTGRPPCHDDHLAESRPASCSQIYVPPDERLSHEKQEELKNNFVYALVRFLAQESTRPPLSNQECPDLVAKIAQLFSIEDSKFVLSIVDFFRRKPKLPPNQDSSNNDLFGIEDLFADKEVKGLEDSVKQKLRKLVPVEIFDKVAATAAAKRQSVSSQPPSIITENQWAWTLDSEFGRQMLAGTNPVRIRRIMDDDPKLQGGKLGELIEKARSEKKGLFILEHHDYLEPFLKMINGNGVCAYATRTILQSGSTLDPIEPIAIELSLPDESDGSHDIRVFSPDDDLWELAKIHVACNDTAYHQLISHWLHTHAVVEPFIIATRRQLSVMHPIHRLLDPHFKDTLHVNALARAFFLNAGGILETTLFTGEYSMCLSSHLYKQWRFDEQALPADLIKRGMATPKEDEKMKEMPAEPESLKTDDVVESVERDENLTEDDVVELDNIPVMESKEQQPTFDAGVKLVLEDYPYAKDGLEIWVATETWVKDYCKLFYQGDPDVIQDTEIQEWWLEIRRVGHGDQDQGWYDINTVEDLVKALTTLIWITSGLHAALNFGQYGYYGWPPNRPMLLRKFVPHQGTPEMDELDAQPDKFLAQMMPEKFQMAFVIAVMDVLSRHTSGEVYLGQASPGKVWETDEIKKKFGEFGEKLKQIERNIKKRNKEYGLLNRWGDAKIPYMLLYPDASNTIAARSKEDGKPERMDINERGNGGCCGLLQTCCHLHDPGNYIIEGDFEIDHSPWLSLCASGLSVAVRIYSQDNLDPSTGKVRESENAYIMKGKVSKRKTETIMGMDVPTKVIKFKLKFEVARDFGIPGAFAVENNDKHEFFLKSASLRYINNPGVSKYRCFRFYCGSWVYPISKTRIKRIFFSNQLYLPQNTPKGLEELRKKELEELRGGTKDERKPWDRTYEYDCYNDLGDPDNGRQHVRPVLGGSPRFPYPRRLRTGRPPCHDDQLAESRPASCSQIYVPPDERLSHEKQGELKNNFVDALVRFLAQEPTQPPLSNQEYPDFVVKMAHFFSIENSKFIRSIVDFFRRKPKLSPNQDPSNYVYDLCGIGNIFADKEVKGLEDSVKQKLRKLVPVEIFDEVVATAVAKRQSVSSHKPSIIAAENRAWTVDTEFGRQMLAGTNPVRIRRIMDDDPKLQGGELEELIKKARSEKKELFILEHHDYLEPFLKMINGNGVCAYATRTILKSGSMLEPIAIELSLPDDSNGIHDIRVFSPDDYLSWELAKIHVACNDTAYHQLISHWLLDPHFKDTLHVNALARAYFLNAGGILETTLFTGEYSMRLSSHLYKLWRFDEQALPADLLKRGMATPKEVEEIKVMPAEPESAKTDDVVESVERDENLTDEDVVQLDNIPETDRQEQQPTFDAGVKLVLEDYPYAKDGLEIWVAIETWVKDYCKLFYQGDPDVIQDTEIQHWWSEIRRVGHRDQARGWYDINTVEDLVKALTTLIWITSGLHAALNFGQYGYYGWPPNRPMLLRKFVPREGTPEMDELKRDPDKFKARMMPEKFQMAFVIAVMDVLSRHTSDEVYLGQEWPEKVWERDEIKKKYGDFGEKLMQIEKNIKARNKEYGLKNRWGAAGIPYKLLYPDASKTMAARSKVKGKPEGTVIHERGIPNSISI